MIRMRARNTVRTTSALARQPGRPRPKPPLAATAATLPFLLDDLAGGDCERAAGLRDERVLQGHVLRADVLERRAVPGDGLDDPRQQEAAVLAHHRQRRAPARLRLDRHPGPPPD